MAVGNGLAYGFGLVPLYFLCWITKHALVLAFVDRPDRLIYKLWQDTRLKILEPGKLLQGVLIVSVFSVFATNFAAMKSVIPELHSYNWDQNFAEWGRILFFGHAPWEILWNTIGVPEVTLAINFMYNIWFFLILVFLYIAAFTMRCDKDRFTYLIAFILVWSIGGNILATILSSAGPVYYERLGFGTDFRELVDLLHAHNEIYPVWALGVQDRLWENYLVGDGSLGGISAMPSLHNAAAVLMAIFAFRIGRRLGIVMSVYAGVIYVGSIYLGWHYALDGVLGAVLAVACWRMAQWIVNVQGAAARSARPSTDHTIRSASQIRT